MLSITCYSFPNDTFSALPNLEFADDEFELDESGEKLSQRVENCGKRRNCSLRAISAFLTCFQRSCMTDT